MTKTGYSQHGEEGAILDYFKDRTMPGKFIDVGAYTGLHLSNTRALAEMGWTGILIEPSPGIFEALRKNYAGMTGFEFINAPLGLSREMVKFYDSLDALGTTEEGNRDKWEKDGTVFTTMWTSTITWKDILERFHGPYNFVSIDTEGTSVELFYQFPIAAARPDVICVEHDGEENAKAIRMYARAFCYSMIYYDGNNIILGLDK